MNELMIEGESVPCEFVLFDLDGTILDDMVRYRTMARARFEVIRDAAGLEAAERWAELSGVDPEDYSVDLRGPLAKAPRKEDITVGAAALWPRGYRWYEAMQAARKLYEEADRLQETRYVPILFEGVAEALRGLKGAPRDDTALLRDGGDPAGRDGLRRGLPRRHDGGQVRRVQGRDSRDSPGGRGAHEARGFCDRIRGGLFGFMRLTDSLEPFSPS
jgi:hypothetical protein